MRIPMPVEMVFYSRCRSATNSLSVSSMVSIIIPRLMHATVKVVREFDDEGPVTGRTSQPISLHSSLCYRECQKFGQFGNPENHVPESFRTCYHHVIREHVARPRNQNFEASAQMINLIS